MYKSKKYIIVCIVLSLFLCAVYRINIYSNINSNENISNYTTNIKHSTSVSSDNVNDENYSILVSSSFAKALVSLDKDNSEVNIKLLDDNIKNVKGYDNYINVTDEDIKFLFDNSDILLSNFKEGNLFDKYSLVCDTIKNYDTDLSGGDLVKIAFMYMK